MSDNFDRTVEDILKSLDSLEYVKSTDIPDINLYMDQVTTFMEEHLQANRRYEDDKILTKTMINNYAKNKLLPAPDKKKYSKEHIIVLIFIYYWKGFLSLSDISGLLHPLTAEYFNRQSGMSLKDIYDAAFQFSNEKIDRLKDEIREEASSAHAAFTDAPADKQYDLQLFSLICSLTMDVYYKKKAIEKLIDTRYRDEIPEKLRKADGKIRKDEKIR